MAIGNLLEIMSQAILAGISSVGRFGVSGLSSGRACRFELEASRREGAFCAGVDNI